MSSTFQPSLSCTEAMEAAMLRLSGDQDKCEIGAGRPDACPSGSIGYTAWVPVLSERITMVYFCPTSEVLGRHPDVRFGPLTSASLVPSGLMAGSVPLPITVWLPPASGIDKTWPRQPPCTA